MAYNNGPRIISDGLVLCLDAGNNKSYPGSGTSWFDISGNGNSCVWNVTPTFNTTHFTFNGLSHYGTITNNSSLNFSTGQTLLIVMRHSFTTGRRNPWDQAYGGYGTWTHEAGNYINYYYGDAGANNVPYVGRPSGTTNRNVWNFMCSTRDVLQSKWYTNEINTETFNHVYADLTATTNNIRIGLGYAGYWEGDMALVLAYNRALTPQEVQQNFNATRGRFGI